MADPTAPLASDGLAAALAADLDGAFERLVLAFQDPIYAFALRLAGSRPDAEEIAQDAFVRAYRALQRYPAERVRALALRPWLYQIALNVWRNRRRRSQPAVEPLGADGDGATLEVADAPSDRPEALALRGEGEAELARALLGLPERYRAAVVLRHVQGLSYQEVAATLGQPVGTAKANVHRGLRLLRAALEPRAVAVR